LISSYRIFTWATGTGAIYPRRMGEAKKKKLRPKKKKDKKPRASA